MTHTNPQAAAAALNRFGLGARPDETPPADPQGWLLDQLARYDPRIPGYAALPDPVETSRAYRQEIAALPKAAATVSSSNPAAAVAPTSPAAMNAPPPMPAMNTLAPQDKKEARQMLRVQLRDHYRVAVDARFNQALATETPFAERLASFWSNHFALSIDKPEVSIWAADYDARAIRPHIMGRFADLLLAAERHPAMLYYLDQFRSIGPGSPFAQRAAAARAPDRHLGLNENLAREAMELHTLGVRAGYTQGDVTEFARALTGWSVDGIGPMSGRMPEGDGRFRFRPGRR